MKPLTDRELECLYWASMGKTSWETGAILGVTERTINFHIQNACRKLQVRGRQAAITAAYRTGLLPALFPQRPLATDSRNSLAAASGNPSIGPMTMPSTRPRSDSQTRACSRVAEPAPPSSSNG